MPRSRFPSDRSIRRYLKDYIEAGCPNPPDWDLFFRTATCVGIVAAGVTSFECVELSLEWKNKTLKLADREEPVLGTFVSRHVTEQGNTVGLLWAYDALSAAATRRVIPTTSSSPSPAPRA